MTRVAGALRICARTCAAFDVCAPAPALQAASAIDAAATVTCTIHDRSATTVPEQASPETSMRAAARVEQVRIHAAVA